MAASHISLAQHGRISLSRRLNFVRDSLRINGTLFS